jgi:hypothetical protein
VCFEILYIHQLQKIFAARCKIIERENNNNGNQESSEEAREEGRKEDRKKEVAAPPTKGNTSGERFKRSPDVFLGADVFLEKGLHW